MTEPLVSERKDPDESILDYLAQRGVTEARHFTTNRGLLGVLQTRSLLSRAHLNDEDQVALIRMNNCYERWDRAWFDYVNLSIQRINGYLYGISSGSWHIGKELWWTVLGFDREVLAHPGVFFTTTNNGYRAVRRAQGRAGLEAVFAQEIRTYKRGEGEVVLRRVAHSDNQPTCPQAEALYPRAVSTQHLRTIYVPLPELADEVFGYLAATGHVDVTVKYDPEAFA